MTYRRASVIITVFAIAAIVIALLTAAVFGDDHRESTSYEFGGVACTIHETAKPNDALNVARWILGLVEHELEQE